MGTVTPKPNDYGPDTVCRAPRAALPVMGPAICQGCRRLVWLYWCVVPAGIGWLPGQRVGGVYLWRQENGEAHVCASEAAAA